MEAGTGVLQKMLTIYDDSFFEICLRQIMSYKYFILPKNKIILNI